MADKGKALAEAKRLEGERRVDEAVRQYINAGSLTDAVRVLVDADRQLDAATLVMKALRITPADAAKLRGKKRQLAHRAAMYFALGGEHEKAITLFTALGDQANANTVRAGSRGSARLSRPHSSSAPPHDSHVHAFRSPSIESMPVVRTSPLPQATEPPPSPIERRRARKHEETGELARAKAAYEELGMLADAGRVARAMGQSVVAAHLYAEAGFDFEAAECFLEAGDLVEALEHLVRILETDTSYRTACIRAVEIASELDAIGLELPRFLEAFVGSGPVDAHELKAFYLFGRLCQAHDLPPLAAECYRAIVEGDRDYLDAADRLEEVGDASTTQQRPDAGHDRTAELPPFPDLELPGETLHARAGTSGQAAPRRFTEPGMRHDSSPKYPQAMPAPSDPGMRHSSDPDRRSPAPAPSEPSLRHISEPRGSRPSRPGRSPQPPAEAATTRAVRTAPAVSQDAELLPLNSVVADRYRIRRVLGVGGMATVYEAHDLEVDTAIALKLFTKGASGTLRRRFMQELKIARELTHRNIVRVYDIGVLDDQRFITMELLNGQELRDLMDYSIELRQAIDLLLQACTALQVAHLRGIIHRDIKPENLFITEAGVLKVMDFGIAKKATGATHITQSGFTAGTPAYMAPEQIMDFGKVTHQCDIYSLGVVAYEMLTGELPFFHEESMPLMMMHVHNAVPSPRLLRPDMPEELEAVLLLALAKHPRDRIKSCVELASRLKAARTIV